MQSGQVGTLKELPDGYFFSPKQGLLHRGSPVGCIVGRVILDFFHARPIPLVGIVVVIGYARTEYIQKRKAFVLDALLDQVGEMLLIAAETARHKSSASGIGFTGASILPNGMLFVFIPMRLVGEVWPVVSP